MGNLPAILELRDLRVLLGGQRRLLRKPVPQVRAVGGVSLFVQQGEILGLVGELPPAIPTGDSAGRMPLLWPRR